MVILYEGVGMGSSSLRVVSKKKTRGSACGLKSTRALLETEVCRRWCVWVPTRPDHGSPGQKPLSRAIEINDGENVPNLAGLWLAITKITFSHVFGTSSDMCDQAHLTDAEGNQPRRLGLNKCQVTERFAKIYQVSNWSR